MFWESLLCNINNQHLTNTLTNTNSNNNKNTVVVKTIVEWGKNKKILTDPCQGPHVVNRSCM